MQKITPFLWFNENAEEAIKFYTSIFKNSKIISESVTPDGKYMLGTFQIEGQEYFVINGGPAFKFTEAISLFVNCKDQAEVDYLWDKLTSNGGQESMCGWLKDKFGLSWQIIPETLTRLMGDKDPKKAKAVMDAMLKMNKIDVKALQDAYDKA
jgi:predicted 3-demethylubiquinone-9 3-methyltransferase (glyoxalase superfamily)